MSEESKDKPQCSTFHGAYDHAQPASIGFPLPVPPPGLTIAHSPSPASPAGLTAAQPPFPAPPQQPLPPSYAHDYQAAPGIPLFWIPSDRFASIVSSFVGIWFLDS